MSGKGFIIASSGPILKQIEYIITLRKIDTILGLLKGFWYLLRFSPKGIMNKTAGKENIEKIPINFDDKIRNTLNVGKRYHSGRISNGVAKGLACSDVL